MYYLCLLRYLCLLSHYFRRVLTFPFWDTATSASFSTFRRRPWAHDTEPLCNKRNEKVRMNAPQISEMRSPNGRNRTADCTNHCKSEVYERVHTTGHQGIGLQCLSCGKMLFGGDTQLSPRQQYLPMPQHGATALGSEQRLKEEISSKQAELHHKNCC